MVLPRSSATGGTLAGPLARTGAISEETVAALIVAAALFAAIAVTSSSTAHVAAFYCPGGTSWDNILHRCV